jgi:hypothetical protein
VLTLAVPAQVDLTLEGLVAEAALERLVTRVLAHVRYQVAALGEGLATHHTLVWLLTYYQKQRETEKKTVLVIISLPRCLSLPLSIYLYLYLCIFKVIDLQGPFRRAPRKLPSGSGFFFHPFARGSPMKSKRSNFSYRNCTPFHFRNNKNSFLSRRK